VHSTKLNFTRSFIFKSSNAETRNYALQAVNSPVSAIPDAKSAPIPGIRPREFQAASGIRGPSVAALTAPQSPFSTPRALSATAEFRRTTLDAGPLVRRAYRQSERGATGKHL